MVGDAGVEWGGRDRVDDRGIMGLLLVSLTVSVHQQGHQTAQYRAAQSHGDHVEHVEVWKQWKLGK